MKTYLYDFESETKYYQFDNVFLIEIKPYLEYDLFKAETGFYTEIVGDVQYGDICIFVYLIDDRIFVFNYYEYMHNIPIKTNLTLERSNYFILKE